MKFIFFFMICAATSSYAMAQSQCMDIFSIHGKLDQRLEEIKAQVTKVGDYQLTMYMRDGFLAEALRRASELGQRDLADRIEIYLVSTLKTDTVKGFPKYIRDGSTEVYLVTLSSGTLAVFKPDPQYWVIDSKKENLYLSNSHAEVASYELSRMFGLQTVPATVMRTIDGKTGSLQVFVQGQQFFVNSRPLVEKVLQDAIDLHIFDYLIRNSDRNEKNILIGGNMLWAIDNGSSFHSQSLSVMAPKFKDLAIEQMSVAFLANLRATTPGVIRKVLEKYPNQSVVEEIILRRGEILRAANSLSMSDK